jgi:hypothetical protein
MPGRQAFQRVIAALVVPFLLVVGTGSACAMFVCDYDKVAREACCCPKSQETPTNGSEDSFTKGCCCDVETVTPADASQARAQVDRFDPSKLHQALLLAVPDFVGPAPSLVLTQTFSIVEHPPAGPPLILLKRSFLI